VTGKAVTFGRTIGTSHVFVRKSLGQVPLDYEWTMLFSPENQPFFLYYEIADTTDGLGGSLEVGFRGAIPFKNGRDIREWEGVVTINRYTERVEQVTARPANQGARISALRRRYKRQLKLSLAYFGGPQILRMRLGPPIELRQLTLTFVPTKAVLDFPGQSRFEVSRVSETGLRRVKTLHTLYTEYRFFETSATPRIE
jgi:hypothetical protein